MTFAREAWPFTLPPTIVAMGLFAFGQSLWASVFLAIAFLLLLFFRIPRVVSDADPNVVLAPAYGRITRIDRVRDSDVGPAELVRIVTFLSVFDVHVQRCPISGRVERCRARSGRNLAAFRDDAGDKNESQLSLLRDPEGHLIAVRQVVGLLARRIVCYLEEGQPIRRGDSMGLIKFGSRVDLLVPSSYEILVEPGQRLTAGKTPVARPGSIDAASS